MNEEDLFTGNSLNVTAMADKQRVIFAIKADSFAVQETGLAHQQQKGMRIQAHKAGWTSAFGVPLAPGKDSRGRVAPKRGGVATFAKKPADISRAFDR